jgi:hypothetical protein
MPTPLPEGREETAFPPSPIRIRHFQPGDEASFKRLNEEWIVQHFVLEDKDRAVLGDPVKYILNLGGRILFAPGKKQLVAARWFPMEREFMRSRRWRSLKPTGGGESGAISSKRSSRRVGL